MFLAGLVAAMAALGAVSILVNRRVDWRTRLESGPEGLAARNPSIPKDAAVPRCTVGFYWKALGVSWPLGRMAVGHDSLEFRLPIAAVQAISPVRGGRVPSHFGIAQAAIVRVVRVGFLVRWGFVLVTDEGGRIGLWGPRVGRTIAAIPALPPVTDDRRRMFWRMDLWRKRDAY
jgi:hypothetical protein